MDRSEAQRLLQACRPDGQDASVPFFAEALALVERDPELKAWWQAEQAFDRMMATKVRDIPLPTGLRDRILTEAVKAPSVGRIPPLAWLAVAALISILCIAGTALGLRTGATSLSALTRNEYTASVLPYIAGDAPALGMKSPDREKLAAWLKDRNSPIGNLPAYLAAHPGVGCQTLSVKGHPVSLMCFSLANGQLFHVFIIDKRALADPPGGAPAELTQAQGWSLASWSDQDKSFVLATHADADALKSGVL